MEDVRIIQGCLNNDRKYQRMLLDKYSSALMATAKRYQCDNHTAKDMLQETWIKVFHGLNGYKEDGKLLPWLKRILINTILRSREKKTIIIQNVAMWNDEIEGIASHSDPLEMEDIMKMIRSICSPAKEIFMMYVIDGFSHNEIGDMMGITASTSRVHLSNARKKLVEILKKNEQLTI
ncbi:MAG: sigma-70 family RNA polymerase sigma factor [Saprospiraceae bacterium]